MKIAQLTDLHLGRANEDTYGVDVRANFLCCLEEIKAFDPDLLVISGDLCFREGDAEVYAYLKAQLQPLAFPVRFLGGNHDDVSLMAEVLEIPFPLHEGELFYEEVFQEEEVHILYLDTSSYRLSANQIRWLQQRLNVYAREGMQQLVFMHHPPLKCTQSGFMDSKHALKNISEVLPLLINRPVSVFCGHYHVARDLHYGRLRVFICPSTFLQIQLKQADFCVDHYRPGWRIIEVQKKWLSTEVRFV